MAERPLAVLLGQSLRFAAVGLLASAVHYGVALTVAATASPYFANLCGYGAAVGLSYFGHRRFTFRVGARAAAHRLRLPRFVATSLSGLLLSQLAYAAAEALDLPEAFGLGVAVLVVPPYTFLLSRFWVFGLARPRSQAGD
jgi:putative flippase GtrA